MAVEYQPLVIKVIPDPDNVFFHLRPEGFGMVCLDPLFPFPLNSRFTRGRFIRYSYMQTVIFFLMISLSIGLT